MAGPDDQEPAGGYGPEFEAAYERGSFRQSGSAQDLASVLPLIRRLRANEEGKGLEEATLRPDGPVHQI
jgi:hypothetical protein